MLPLHLSPIHRYPSESGDSWPRRNYHHHHYCCCLLAIVVQHHHQATKQTAATAAAIAVAVAAVATVFVVAAADSVAKLPAVSIEPSGSHGSDCSVSPPDRFGSFFPDLQRRAVALMRSFCPSESSVYWQQTLPDAVAVVAAAGRYSL